MNIFRVRLAMAWLFVSFGWSLPRRDDEEARRILQAEASDWIWRWFADGYIYRRSAGCRLLGFELWAVVGERDDLLSCFSNEELQQELRIRIKRPREWDHDDD